jgi:glycerate kinase
MRVVIAPDKFKGSLSAPQVAAAIARGLKQSMPDAEIEEIPIADGGEGTMALISRALGADTLEADVTDPLGRPVIAGYGLADAMTAVLEMSSASGLVLVDEEQRDPWLATTFGTGELIRAALASGAEEVVIGIGGSATNDGGLGMAEALGYQPSYGADGQLIEIRCPQTRPQELARFVTACDVSNPLLGPEGCTRIYGAQKGIDPQDFEKHERRLRILAEIVRRDVADISPDTPGAGAAGGLGFGLMAFCGAELRSGFDLVADLTGLQQAIARADLVITGEGSMDAQTLMGKGPAGVADMAHAAGKRVIAFCGVARDADALLGRFDQIISLEGRAENLQDSIARAAELLEAAGRDLCDASL